MSRKLSLNEWSRAGLLRLPTRKWDTVSSYDSLLVLSAGRKHDSGWAVMAIVGVRKGLPVEIAAQCCDDIEWKFPAMRRFGPNGKWSIGQVRTDCAFKSGAIHLWAHEGSFRVGCALSSVSVEFVGAAANVTPLSDERERSATTAAAPKADETPEKP